MKGYCSVCALPADVRETGEQMIVSGGKMYREVAKLREGGPSKSSWFRHMHGCFRRREYYGRSKAKHAEFRLHIRREGDKPTGLAENEIELLIVHENRAIEIELATQIEPAAELPAALPEPPRIKEPEPERSEPIAAPEPAAECEPHDWKDIAANTRRCQKCGKQTETRWQAVGVRRKREKQDNRLAHLFGRFG